MLENQAAKAAIIREQFALASRQPVELTTIPFENAVLLHSLIRAGASEDFSHIAPLATFTQPFTPTDTLAIEFLAQIYEDGWISVHPETPLDSVEFSDDSIAFELDRVLWVLPVEALTSTSADTAAHLEAFLHNQETWLPHWHDQQSEFARKIAIYECLQHLEVSLAEHAYPFGVVDKAVQVFDVLLDDYAVAQVFNFIWRALRDTTDYYQREASAKKQHAARIIVDSIQKQGADAKSGHWDVKPYHRGPKSPQSIVSAVLFNDVLHLGDDAFYKSLR